MKVAKSPLHAQNCVDKVNSTAVITNQKVQKPLNGENESLLLMLGLDNSQECEDELHSIADAAITTRLKPLTDCNNNRNNSGRKNEGPNHFRS